MSGSSVEEQTKNINKIVKNVIWVNEIKIRGISIENGRIHGMYKLTEANA